MSTLPERIVPPTKARKITFCGQCPNRVRKGPWNAEWTCKKRPGSKLPVTEYFVIPEWCPLEKA